MSTIEQQSPNTPPVTFQIIVSGSLDERWTEWFGGLAIRSEMAPGGTTTTHLTGALKDQAALRGVLIKLWDLNLDVISVQQSPPVDRDGGTP